MNHKPPFHSSKWFVVLLIFLGLLMGFFWFAHKHAQHHRQAYDANVSQEISDGLRKNE